jgi:hypothetical protein
MIPMALQIVYRDVNQIPAVGSPSCVATGVEITAIAGTIQKETWNSYQGRISKGI